ncbi:MAG: hypothetical protein B6230_05295 [Desulfobacteraceae bacterium 4572_89]|nr:MAG: hypothetical protein B6230_05295 [Desulfobacteraceae bacterium 4572_89]
MKITDPQVIKNGEKDLLEAVQDNLDLNMVRQILKDRMKVSSLSSRGGQIIVHENKIAFRMDFDINLSGSLLFDREGNYIEEQDEDALMKTETEEKMELSGFELDESLPEQESDESNPDETDFVETDLNEAELDETELDEPEIFLPEYDLEDEPELEDGPELELSNQEESNTKSLEMEPNELLSDESDPLADESKFIAESDTQEISKNENIPQEEMIDDDINDILKESREFWEQKKDS